MVTRPLAQLVDITPLLRPEAALKGLALSEIAGVLADAAGHWIVESILEPGGDRGVVVMPESGDDADGATLVIWQLEASFRLDEVRDDAYRTIARCTTVDVVSGIRRWIQSEPRSSLDRSRQLQATRKSASPFSMTGFGVPSAARAFSRRM